MNDYAVSDNVDCTVSLYDAFKNITAGNFSDFRNLKCISDFDHTDNLFLNIGGKHSFHGELNFFNSLVYDSVFSYIDLFLIGQEFGLRSGAYVKAYD